MRTSVMAATALLLMWLSTLAISASTYKCTDDKQRVRFQDKPCQAHEQQQTRTPSSSQAKTSALSLTLGNGRELTLRLPADWTLTPDETAGGITAPGVANLRAVPARGARVKLLLTVMAPPAQEAEALLDEIARIQDVQYGAAEGGQLLQRKRVQVPLLEGPMLMSQFRDTHTSGPDDFAYATTGFVAGRQDVVHFTLLSQDLDSENFRQALDAVLSSLAQ